MKKIIFIILLLFAVVNSYGQWNAWDVQKQWDAWTKKNTVTITNDTIRLYAIMDLTRDQKDKIGAFLIMVKDTVSNDLGFTVVNLSDAFYMFMRVLDTKANSILDWTGQYNFYEVDSVAIIPYQGLYSVDSSYIMTNFKSSDIKQKTNISIGVIARKYIASDYMYEFGVFYGPQVGLDSGHKYMSLHWDVSTTFMGLGGEHTQIAIGNPAPWASIGSRTGIDAGEDSLWLFYGNNQIETRSDYITHRFLDSTITYDSCWDILNCNNNGSHFRPSERGVGWFFVTKFALSQNGARGVNRCFSWLDNAFGVYDHDADSLFLRLVDLPDSDKVGINELIVRLKDTLNILHLSDGFNQFCLAMNSDTNSRINWVKDSIHATNVGSCTFTPYQGFQTTSSGTKYINTNYNSNPNLYPAWNGGSFGCISYTQSGSAVAGFDMGASTSAGTYIGARWTGDVCFWNLINWYKNTHACTKTKGILGVNTAGTSSMSFYINDSIVETNTATRTSTLSDNLAFFVGCDNASGTPTYYTGREYMGWWFGKEMTATQYRGFVNCIKAYFLRKGKAI